MCFRTIFKKGARRAGQRLKAVVVEERVVTVYTPHEKNLAWRIRNFDLAHATPERCFEFMRTLKEDFDGMDKHDHGKE